MFELLEKHLIQVNNREGIQNFKVRLHVNSAPGQPEGYEIVSQECPNAVVGYNFNPFAGFQSELKQALHHREHLIAGFEITGQDKNGDFLIASDPNPFAVEATKPAKKAKESKKAEEETPADA